MVFRFLTRVACYDEPPFLVGLCNKSENTFKWVRERVYLFGIADSPQKPLDVESKGVRISTGQNTSTSECLNVRNSCSRELITLLISYSWSNGYELNHESEDHRFKILHWSFVRPIEIPHGYSPEVTLYGRERRIRLTHIFSFNGKTPSQKKTISKRFWLKIIRNTPLCSLFKLNSKFVIKQFCEKCPGNLRSRQTGVWTIPVDHNVPNFKVHAVWPEKATVKKLVLKIRLYAWQYLLPKIANSKTLKTRGNCRLFSRCVVYEWKPRSKKANQKRLLE
ncbi:hypothetical protein CLF_110790 [Clonorchis sinensis]|uniref:Uncharacterized protein n=1 Tax=Clonorchis sinensis TaxID=79923 RepID=G7YTW1_CLOSI|nr:hypothetical protein CLF_110790 [Clonorchis sinensis]